MAYSPKHLVARRRAARTGGPATASAITGVTMAATALGTASSAHAAGLPDVLQKIRYCESGGNYQAQNPTSTASGAFQFLDTTWQNIPGTSGYSRAEYAPQSVQDQAAVWLYDQMGTSPWLASMPCWSKLGGTPSVSLTNTGGSSTTPAQKPAAAPKPAAAKPTAKPAVTPKPAVAKPEVKTAPVAPAKPAVQAPAVASQTPAKPAQPANAPAANGAASSSNTMMKPAVAHAENAAQPVAPQATQVPTAQTPSSPVMKPVARPVATPVAPAAPYGAPAKSVGQARFAYAHAPLTAQDQASSASVSAAATKQMASAKGQQVTLVATTTLGHPGVTHVAPNSYSADAGYVAGGQSVTGHYVDASWFEITAGPQAGQYVSASLLSKGAQHNGALDVKSQLVAVPSYLVAGSQTVYLKAEVVQALIKMHASLRVATGGQLVIVDGYRSLATQEALFKQYGAPQAAKPGTSNHGTGLAVGVNNAHSTAAMTAWLKANARGFGFVYPGTGAPGGYMTIDFVG